MVATQTDSAPKASYEVNTLSLRPGPLHEQLIACFNELHEARATGDTRTIRELEELVPPLLDEFDRTECQETPNPGWLSNKMHGGWHVAKGEFESALKFEIEGFHHADAEVVTVDGDTTKDHRKSVSASNIADELWRLGRAREGLPWAKLSVDLWPSNSINHLVLAITAYHAGLRREADEILTELRQAAKFEDERDVLSQCMSFERELHHMTQLPSVQGLLEDMEVRK